MPSRLNKNRRPKRENLYDVFATIRDDELEQVKTKIACQQPEAREAFQSPHNAKRSSFPESIKTAIDSQTRSLVGETKSELSEIKLPTK